MHPCAPCSPSDELFGKGTVFERSVQRTTPKDSKMNRFIVYLIQLYKKWISPMLPAACRFSPTCSEYAMQAFQSYPFFIALYLSTRRLLRCHPLSEGYEDPLPQLKFKKKRDYGRQTR